MDSSQIFRLQKWLEARAHQERVLLLLLAFTCIYLFFKFVFLKPIATKRTQLQQQIQVVNNQITIYKASIEKLQHLADVSTKNAKTLEEESLGQGVKTVLRMPLPNDKGHIMEAILAPAKNIIFTDFKSNALASEAKPDKQPNTSVKQNVQITFQSNYFDTINYLAILEKLPWCLAWDSLEYKVINYPVASVVIILNITANE